MVSIKDVAHAAGVSLGTASNVLNRPGAVSPELRERVERAIDVLGYVRNESARQLRAGVSRTIAIVVLDVGNPFFTDVVSGAEQAAEDGDALVIICNSGHDAARERRHLVRLEEQRVMGILLTPVGDGVHPLVEQLERRGTCVVLVDRVSPDATRASVAVDDLRGGLLAGGHLLERGHRDVAFIGGPTSLRQVAERLEGLRQTAAGRASVHVIVSEDMSVRAGSRAAARLFATWPDPADRPTAVFCANDLLAIGVLNECLRRGVRVPDELALVGYDDISFATTATVPLSSVRQPREQLGRTAVELLLERVGDPAGAARQVLFEPELVVRESS